MVGTQPTGSVKNSTLHMCGMTSSTTGASSRVLTVAALLYLYGLLAATLPVLSNGVMSSLHHKHARIQSHKAGTNTFNAVTARLLSIAHISAQQAGWT